MTEEASPLDKIGDFLEDTFSKREPGVLPSAVTDMVEKMEAAGEGDIKTMSVIRSPVQDYVAVLMNAISEGKYTQAIKDSDYDNLFHLQLHINGKYRLEKNEVISLTENEHIPKEANFMRVPVPRDGSVSIRAALDKTRDFMGPEDFTSYNARTNNCQDFVMGVLSGNDWNSDLLVSFVHQDAEQIFAGLPDPDKTTDIALACTDIAAVADKLMEDAKEKIEEGQGKQQKIRDRVAELHEEHGEEIPKDALKSALKELDAGPAEAAAVLRMEAGRKFGTSSTKAFGSIRESHGSKKWW